VTGLGSPNFNVIANLVLNNATAFPNVGAYPVGSSSATSAAVDGGDDDDTEDEAVRLSALVIACVAFALAIVALVVSFCAKPAMSSSSN